MPPPQQPQLEQQQNKPSRQKFFTLLLVTALIGLFVVAAFSGRPYLDATMHVAATTSGMSKRSNVDIKKEYRPEAAAASAKRRQQQQQQRQQQQQQQQQHGSSFSVPEWEQQEQQQQQQSSDEAASSQKTQKPADKLAQVAVLPPRSSAPPTRNKPVCFFNYSKSHQHLSPFFNASSAGNANFDAMVQCSLRLKDGYFWKWASQLCAEIPGFRDQYPPLLPYEVSSEEMSCIPSSNYSSSLLPPHQQEQSSLSVRGSNHNNKNGPELHGLSPWVNMPFSSSASSPSVVNPHDVVKMYVEKNFELFVQREYSDNKNNGTDDNNNNVVISIDDVSLLMRHYSNFMYFTSWLFRQWKPWRPNFRLLMSRPQTKNNNGVDSDSNAAGVGAGADQDEASSQQHLQQQLPHFKSFHDPESENIYRVEHFCISPFHGLSGFDPSKAPFKGKDDTRDVYHGLKSFRRFFSQVTPLKSRPRIFDQRPVIFVPVGEHSRHNLAHVLHQVLGVVGIMLNVKLTGGKNSNTNARSFSTADDKHAWGDDARSRSKYFFDVVQKKLQPLLVFVNTMPPSTAAEASRDNTDDNQKQHGKKNFLNVKQYYKEATTRTAAWGFFFRLLDLPVASVFAPSSATRAKKQRATAPQSETARNNNNNSSSKPNAPKLHFIDDHPGDASTSAEDDRPRNILYDAADADAQYLLTPEFVSSLFRLTKHSYDPFSRKQDGNAVEARVCFESGIAYQNCFSCTERPESETESYSFGDWTTLTRDRQIIVDTYRHMTRNCLGPFPSWKEEARRLQQKHQKHAHAAFLPRLFIDVRSTFRGIADFGLFFDKIKSKLVDEQANGHRWIYFVGENTDDPLTGGGGAGTGGGLSVREPWTGSRGTYMEQLRAADIFIGPHGAAFSSVAQMKKGSTVIEVTSPNHFCSASPLLERDGGGGGGAAAAAAAPGRARRSFSSSSRRKYSSDEPADWWKQSCWFGTLTKAAGLDHWLVLPASAPDNSAPVQSRDAAGRQNNNNNNNNNADDFVVPWTFLVDVIRSASCRWQRMHHNVDHGGCDDKFLLPEAVKFSASSSTEERIMTLQERMREHEKDSRKIFQLSAQKHHLGNTEFVASLYAAFGNAPDIAAAFSFLPSSSSSTNEAHEQQMRVAKIKDFIASQSSSLLWLLSAEFVSSSSPTESEFVGKKDGFTGDASPSPSPPQALESCSDRVWAKILFHLFGKPFDVTRRRSAELTDTSDEKKIRSSSDDEVQQKNVGASEPRHRRGRRMRAVACLELAEWEQEVELGRTSTGVRTSSSSSSSSSGDVTSQRQKQHRGFVDATGAEMLYPSCLYGLSHF